MPNPDERKIRLPLIFILLLLVAPAVAQDQGNVTINSEPQGSLVRLKGDLSFSGVTPVNFDRSLSGRYEIEVIRDGFERNKSTAYFSEAQPTELNIRLVPKTRFKSAVRSVIIPGWGQRYYGDKTKSTLFALGAVAAAITYYFVKDDFDDKKEVYLDRKTARDEATKWEEIHQLDLELYDAQKAANDAEDWVNIVAVSAASLYVLNLLDSFFLFPETNTFTEYKALTVRPKVGENKIGLTLALEF